MSGQTVLSLSGNPCLQCGACCTSFRVSFHWSECDDFRKNGVPCAMTEPVTPHRVAMRGTNSPQPRCIALQGTVGEAVYCAIHPRRASVCRDFSASWQDGADNKRCTSARAGCGLPPLTPDHWRTTPDRTPETTPRLPQAA